MVLFSVFTTAITLASLVVMIWAVAENMLDTETMVATINRAMNLLMGPIILRFRIMCQRYPEL